MTILLPLYLLKLRREVDNAKRRRKQREATLRKLAKSLKKLIELLSLLDRLYDYLYGNITEFREEEANNVLSDILELKYDSKFIALELKHDSKFAALELKYCTCLLCEK